MAAVVIGTGVPDDGIKNVSMNVSTDLSGKQFLAMKVSGDLKIDTQTSAGAKIAGVLQDAPDGSGTATYGALKTSGFTFAIAGGTCTAGAYLTVDSAGKFVDETGSNKEVPALCWETGATGNRIVIQLVHNHTE